MFTQIHPLHSGQQTHNSKKDKKLIKLSHFPKNSESFSVFPYRQPTRCSSGKILTELNSQWGEAEFNYRCIVHQDQMLYSQKCPATITEQRVELMYSAVVSKRKAENPAFLVANIHSSNSSSWSVTGLLVGWQVCPQMCDNIFIWYMILTI